MVSIYQPNHETLELVYSKSAQPLQTDEQMAFRQDRLVERREALKLSQDELAQQLKTSQQAISGYEKGLHKPSMAMLVSLARALQCSTDYLLGLVEQADPLGGLTDDERTVLNQYRSRRTTIQDEVINEGIAKLADPIRDQVKRIIARLLHEQGKFDNRTNNP